MLPLMAVVQPKDYKVKLVSSFRELNHHMIFHVGSIDNGCVETMQTETYDRYTYDSQPKK